MTTIHVPSGAVAILDLEDLPEEAVEALRARQALTVQFHNPRTYRVYTTPDGFEARVVSPGAKARRVLRHLGVAAAVALVGGMLLYRAPDLAVAEVDYQTTDGRTVHVRGNTVRAITGPGSEPAADPRLVEVLAPRLAPLASRDATRVSPAPTTPAPASTPTLPAPAPERATEAVREAPARSATKAEPKPEPTPVATPDAPGLDVRAALPGLPEVKVTLGR
jgi:hypothetical protein